MVVLGRGAVSCERGTPVLVQHASLVEMLVQARGSGGKDVSIHLQSLTIHELGFNQNHNMFVLTLLIKIVLWSSFP